MKIALFVALCLLALPAKAVENNADSGCAKFSEMAESIMEARQAGVPMRKLMSTLNSTDTEFGPALKQLVAKIIQQAYEQPQYQTDGMINRTKVEFGNEMYLLCQNGK